MMTSLNSGQERAPRPVYLPTQLPRDLYTDPVLRLGKPGGPGLVFAYQVVYQIGKQALLYAVLAILEEGVYRHALWGYDQGLGPRSTTWIG